MRLETARGESQVTKSGFAFRRGEPSCPTVVVVPEAIGGVGKKMASGTLVVTPGLSDKRLDALFFFFFFSRAQACEKGNERGLFCPVGRKAMGCGHLRPDPGFGVGERLCILLTEVERSSAPNAWKKSKLRPSVFKAIALGCVCRP